jgi:hypothetical protein
VLDCVPWPTVKTRMSGKAFADEISDDALLQFDMVIWQLLWPPHRNTSPNRTSFNTALPPSLEVIEIWNGPPACMGASGWRHVPVESAAVEYCVELILVVTTTPGLAVPNSIADAGARWRTIWSPNVLLSKNDEAALAVMVNASNTAAMLSNTDRAIITNNEQSLQAMMTVTVRMTVRWGGRQ